MAQIESDAAEFVTWPRILLFFFLVATYIWGIWFIFQNGVNIGYLPLPLPI